MENTLPKKIIVSIVSITVCALCAFALVSCEKNNSSENAQKPVCYTVTFHYNTGVEEDSSSASVESGKTAADKVPEILHSAGYAFDGWCTDKELTHDFDIENTPVTSDISLYARWRKEYDRAWFLSKLGECAANATSDGVVRTKVSYKVKFNNADTENFTSEIVNGGITVGDYNIRLLITAEWFEKEFLNGDNITVTSELYNMRGTDEISATVHYVNGENEKCIYSFKVDKYGYISGCSEKIDNGEGETNTSLYILSSVQYE
ncbi:MAG: InlB B-repeat-containing protein [Eubacteriales bacterium]